MPPGSGHNDTSRWPSAQQTPSNTTLDLPVFPSRHSKWASAQQVMVLYTENIPSVIRQRWWLECVVTVCHFTTLAAASSFPPPPPLTADSTHPNALLTRCVTLLWNWPQEIGPSSPTSTSLVKGCGQQPFRNSREDTNA